MGRPVKFSGLRMTEMWDSGMTIAEIADGLGCTPDTVRRKLPRQYPQSDDAEVDMSGERCGCGLRLPCNACLDTVGTATAPYTVSPDDTELTYDDWREIDAACDRYLAKVKAAPAKWGAIDQVVDGRFFSRATNRVIDRDGRVL